MVSRSPSSHRAPRLLLLLSSLLVLAALAGPARPPEQPAPLPSPGATATTPILSEEARVAAWQARNDGLPGHAFVTSIVSLPAQAGSPTLLAAAYGPRSLYRSDDGISWQLSDDGLAGVGVFTLARHPRDVDVVYAGTVAGVYRSDDRGASWRQLAAPHAPIYSFLIDPGQPDVILAGSIGALWQSSDGGATWEATASGLDGVSLLSLTYAGSERTLYAGTNGGGIMAARDGVWASVYPTTTVVSVLASDPLSAQHVLARAQDTLLRSSDGGATWTAVLPGPGSGLLGVVFDHRAPGIVYALDARSGVLVSEDGGVAWRPLAAALDGEAVYALALPDDGPRLLAGTVHGVWRMTAEQQWIAPAQSLGEPVVRALALSPRGELVAGTTDGVFIAANDRWQRLGNELRNVQVLSLGFLPGAPPRVTAGTWTHGVQVSDDSGVTWRQTTGQQFTDIIVPAVSIDPGDPSNVYARVEYARLLISRDGGESWAESSLPVTVTVFAIAVAPGDSARLYVGTDRGVYRSDDRGEHWLPTGGPPGAGSVLALAVDPADAGVVYAGNEGGLHRSHDSGHTWHAVAGLPDQTVTALAIHPADSGTIYCGTRYDGVFASRDGGATWRHTGLHAGVNALVIAAEEETLYAATERGVYALHPLAAAPVAAPRRPAAAVLPAAPPQSRAGVAVAVHTLRADGRLVALASEAGFSALVQVLPWRDVEPEKGEFIWESADALLRAAEFYGLDVILRLDFQPLWARDTWGNAPPQRLEDYGDFVQAVAARYRGRVRGYIIWNEPNLAVEWGGDRPDAARYSALLAIAYERIKQADPQALVVSAGLAPTNENDDRAIADRLYLRAMYAAGAGASFDVLAAHPYGFGLPPDDAPGAHAGLNMARLVDLRAIMVENGDAAKPVWITEFGWTTAAADEMHGGYAVSEHEQAAYLAQACAQIRSEWPWVRVITVWNMSVGLGVDDQMRGYSIINDDHAPKPAYTALQVLNGGHAAPPAPQTVQQPGAIEILAADVAIHLGDQDYLVWPWVHTPRRQVPATEWRGEFYVHDPGSTDWNLTLDAFQLNEWGNHIAINGQPLDPPFLPGRVNDWAGYWTRVRWRVPAAVLRSGVNSLSIRTSMNAPVHQAHGVSWEDLQFRNIILHAGPAR